MSANAKAPITDLQKEAITRRAAAILEGYTEPVRFELSMTLTLGLIGQLQLGFRHPQNTGPTRQLLEEFVRGMIEQIDPAHGDVHALLMIDERYDE